MSLVGFKGQNHPQQTAKRGAKLEVDNLQTTPEMFAPLHERFRFTLDAAALPHNTKVPRYFAPPGWDAYFDTSEQFPLPLGIDGLAQPWDGERAWCNPPYSALPLWCAKAWHEWHNGADLIVMLLPANRCEQGWWQEHIEPFRDRGGALRTEFIAKRQRFILHGHDRVEPNQRPPFGCVLAIWGPVT